ncbi:hypothetical protein [Streptomyces sp. W1SF4]|uniref:hypothetical protein n=1 Tax=Streptomyces sp. W1SF4 TaxID=2305220 RepID=UPI000F71D4FD|nr:hypothetical protein [Streptomyces sp. W1SF4]AZM91436.1 hypothetical protein D1J60_25615 [Streptomyces sp. W1SF4]
MDQNMISALLAERAGYERSGRAERMAQVDEQLAHHGYEVPAERQAPPQDTADTEDRPRGRGRPKLPRDAEGNIIRE